MRTARDFSVLDCPLDGVRLIEASAGTGKTWNICGLYLRLLVERALPVEEILVVTFTKAATAELRTRIRQRIVETLAYLGGGTAGSDPFVPAFVSALEARELGRERITSVLDAALQSFDDAAVFTIHGYCQRALAESPFAAGLPFALELAEDDQELRLETARDFWRRHVASGECPAALGELLAARGDCPETWAELLGRFLARPMAEVRWPEEDEALSADEARDEGDLLAAAFREAVAAWGADGSGPCKALLDALAGLNAQSYSELGIAAGGEGWRTWLAGGDPFAPVDPEGGKLRLFRAQVIAERTKKKHTPPSHPFFDAAECLLALRERLAERLEAQRRRLLRRFLEEGAADLRARKRELRRIAFDDILYNVHQALAGGHHPWLAAELHRRHPVALIDEFQDTDPLQFDIFRRIYRDEGRHGTLFLVGDPKQAIYSFRNADLHTYLHARGQADERYTLRHNQRSAGGLIAACNRLFQANPAAFVLEGLDYEPVSEGDKPRKPFIDRSSTPSEAALHLWRLPAGGDGQPPLRRDAMGAAAAASAAEIARLIREGAAGRILIGDRSLQPGDVAVLVRSHAQGTRMRTALAALGVGSVELSQASIFHTPDAEELERVLLAILEPARQPLLFAALATTFMGRDAAALDGLAADESGLLAVVGRFAALRDAWLARGFGVMLRQWMETEGVAARLLARDDGERRLTNLLHLAESLHEASAAHRAPDALMRWLATRRQEAAGGEAAQLRLESDRNLVQIVTIHRAKGLEYGVVFCPFLWDALAAPGERGEACVYHDADDALVLDFRPAARDDEEVAYRLRRERDAETLRLIYVALTRAVHRAYLVAGCYGRSFGRSVSCAESARSLLNWLVAGAGRSHREWVDGKRAPEEIDAAWQGFAETAAPHVRLEDLPAGAGEVLRLPQPAAETLRALPPPAAIPASWRIGSFSALSHGAQREQAAQDHDARALDAAEIWGAGEAGALPGPPPAGMAHAAPDGTAPAPRPGPSPLGLAPDDILLFPRGPAAGDCLHAVFERVDFADPAGWDEAIAAALAEHPQRVDDASAAARLPRMLRRMLADVLARALPEGIVLGRLAPARRVAELGFHLPAPAISSAALNDWLARYGYGVPRLAFGALAGYLKGYIDLVFEHRGRYYLLDWKSNHLGWTPGDYGPDRLEAAMRAHGYHLQHLLYGVALHRHLARSVPGYDYERHFGGALYLFVRGLRPDWDAEGGPAGVFFHRPAQAVLAGLDALIAGPPRGRGARASRP